MALLLPAGHFRIVTGRGLANASGVAVMIMHSGRALLRASEAISSEIFAFPNFLCFFLFLVD